MAQTQIHLAWSEDLRLREFRSGVSLHSHTSHSKETLEFIPRMLAGAPPALGLLKGYESRYRRIHGRELDYRDAWWTPPLGPKEALRVERQQIEALGLAALVSISDHDNIEAPQLLRVLSESRDTPVSVEWTVPWRGAFFHLGVHNMGPRRAAVKMAAMERFTADAKEPELRGLLDWLEEDDETLIIFNHPYWDEKGQGQVMHDALAEEFLSAYRRWIHALELNGLRQWRENRRTLSLAARRGLPAISGGDRHGCEPNALINLTGARTFAEFVEEVRVERRSTVLLMPQYREPMVSRIIRVIGDVMRDHDQHTHGWTKWSDRVFYRRQPDRLTVALREAFQDGREPRLIRLCVAGARLLLDRRVQAAMRQVLQPAQEFPV
jgi:hypothetical protein